VDVLGGRTVFGAGLVLSGVVNLLCGSTTSFVTMSGLWAANGFFQGFGGPACAKLLTQWIPVKERGVWCATESRRGRFSLLAEVERHERSTG
jgi:OPA family sugar phosphate sensor protein UhpC-like MFS transporter